MPNYDSMPQMFLTEEYWIQRFKEESFDNVSPLIKKLSFIGIHARYFTTTAPKEYGFNFSSADVYNVLHVITSAMDAIKEDEAT